MNVEPLRARVQDDEVGGNIDATFSGRVGNVQTLNLGAAGILGGRSGPHFGFLAASGDYGRVDATATVAQYFAHIRYNYALVPRVAWEIFGQVDHDRFQRLTLRRLAGTGPRFEAIETSQVSLALGTAYMLELEDLSATDEDPAQDNTWHRSSNSVALRLAPDDRVSLSVSALFQPRFDRPGDYRLLQINALAFEVVDKLTASVGVTVRYDSVPPRGVKALDLAVKNAIGLKL